jgi:hypothetical protein
MRQSTQITQNARWPWAADFAEIMDPDDVGVIEPGQGASLAGEAFGEGRITPGFVRQNLERHRPVELPLPGLIYRAHAALT